jgi:2-C-methyl-D-erythritol 4-phosphate cytidylyltransferase/2-C-methyl-D-erythritol 2,4-cyclodiphosphate synthase
LKTAALIVAAGRGTRVGGPVPKQYVRIGGVSVLARALRPFLDHPDVSLVAVAITRGEEALYRAAVGGVESPKLVDPIWGGATRQGSVANGLGALRAHGPDRVLIHDAARPFVTGDIIDRVLGALAQSTGAIAALPLSDTLKATADGDRIAATVDRAGLWRAQTPQGFRFGDILQAHERAQAAGLLDMTDDAAVAEWAGLPVALVLGSSANAKLTTSDDFALAERAVGGPEVRVGQGFDVHRLVAGDHVWLCGVRLAHTQALEGHSDADVALHALTDALLGAIGAGDIGEHFPDADPRWRGAASAIFIAEALRLVRARGGRIGNIDVTLICEAPRIAPHRDAMRRRLAELLELEEARVSVKATTTEGLGFAGRREGIAAVATAMVILG